MTVPTMPPMPPIPTIPTTMMHESECYRFWVKETADSESGQEIVFSRMLLKELRIKLRKQFGVPENRRIFYIDDDGDNVPIDSECEFHEALKLAKSAFEMNNAIPLIVGSFNVPDDEQYSSMHENRCPDKEQLKNVDDKSTWNKFFKPYGPFCLDDDPIWKHMEPIEPLPEHIWKPWRPIKPIKPIKPLSDCTCKSIKPIKPLPDHIWKPLPSQKKFDAKGYNEPNETKVPRIDAQTELKDVDIQRELNASLRYCSDALPPLWFTEYMESMKRDMVSTITNEVVKNVTEALNKRLDTLAFSPLKELDQSGSQYSSLATRHPQCSSDSNEENQKKIRSQDKEQLSDVSIKRADEPRNANTMKNIQIKKDVISTISNEVVKEVTELLDKIPADPLTSVPSKDPFRSQFPSHFPSSTRLSRNLYAQSGEKNEKTIRPQDREQSSDNALTVRVDESSWYSNILENSTRQLQKRLDLIEDVIRANAEEEKNKKLHQQNFQSYDFISNNNDIGRGMERPVRNNTWEEFVSRNISSPLQIEIDPKPSDERVHLEALKLIENEFRMNCSVTGHQMLDEGLLTRDICNTFDKKLLEIEKDVLSDNMTSFWSCDQEEKGEKEKEEDDDAFEIIQMPALTDELFIPFEEPAIEQQHHDSNRDSPSFELLSEPPSPPCSIHLNEDHFSANEEKLEQHSIKTNPSNSVYVVDVHGKIFDDEHQTVDPDERVSVDLEKQPGVTYSFVVNEDLLTEDEDEARSSKSPCTEAHRPNERKIPRDDADGSYDDVINSHASYLTVQTHCDSKTQSQCSCQSQTDSGDFTQSFHSHTTSVTDTTDMYAHTYPSKYGEQVLTTAKDVRESTATAAPRNNHDVRVDGGWTRETRTDAKYCHDKCPNNYPEYLCAPNNSCPCSRDHSFGASYQPYRASRSSDRSSSNVGSRKTPAGEQALLSTADSVHILPETLVSAAAQVGSFAYDTAREMFDKLRAHTKEDPHKRRGGVKCENKKPFSVGHLPFY